jgi:hypothetical protein
VGWEPFDHLARSVIVTVVAPAAETSTCCSAGIARSCHALSV